ncbi:MAG: spermidine synthase [Pseudomonadota bacterium]
MRLTEPEITLSESDGVRYLHFGTEWVQGAMRLDDPVVIEIEYVQQMMAWLLFLRAEQRVLQLGLGAGALTRFTHRRLPQAHTTVVEASTRVIETCRRWFRLPPNDSRLAVLHDDASRFVGAAEARSFSVIQCDLYDAQAKGPVLDSLAFYRQCFRVLDDPGVLVVNLFGSSRPAFERSAARIAQAFAGRVLEMPQTLAGNIVLLAFRGPPFAIRWPAIEQRARVVQGSIGLDAASWVQGIRRRAPAGAAMLKVGAVAP